MRSVTALWFSIETVFAKVHELCVEARAAQMVLEASKAAPARPKSTLLSGAGLPAVLAGLDPNTSRDPRLAPASKLALDSLFREQHPGGADIVGMREQIEYKLKWLRAQFDAVFRSDESLKALFPIIIYIDEIMKLSAGNVSSRWESFQSQLYDIDNGGEAFFEKLEEALQQEETDPLILEIFYYCLAAGFIGAYQRDQYKIKLYQDRLAARFVPPPEEPEPTEVPGKVLIVPFPWEYYAAGVGVVLAVYLTLSWLAAPG
jgi:type IV/VI secretion system ImpK/VasF family protein